jgi:pyruvate kinase
LVKSKTEDSVKCEVIDGGELKSRRHLNVRGKSATLPSITGNNRQLFSLSTGSNLHVLVSYTFQMYRQGLGRH